MAFFSFKIEKKKWISLYKIIKNINIIKILNCKLSFGCLNLGPSLIQIEFMLKNLNSSPIQEMAAQTHQKVELDWASLPKLLQLTSRGDQKLKSSPNSF